MSADKNLPPSLRPAIGVGVLVWRGKQLLLGERIEKEQNNCWQFPGGFLEADESVVECARREVLEETSLMVKGLRHFGFTDKAFDAVTQKVITLLVSCEYSSGEVQLLEPEKCTGWTWFDYDDLPTPLFKPIENYLSQLASSQLVTGQDVISTSGDLYTLHCASPILVDAPSVEHK